MKGRLLFYQRNTGVVFNLSMVNPASTFAAIFSNGYYLY